MFSYSICKCHCGGILAGIGGAYISMAYVPTWMENMVAGRGWIAVALVIFATWNPLNALWGPMFWWY